MPWIRLVRRWLLPLLFVVGLVWPLQAQEALPPAEPVEIEEPNPLLRYQPGAQTYIAACATCHIALPPEVLPSESWRRLLLDVNHYSVQIEVLQEPYLQIAWEYLRDFSRGLGETEPVPYRLQESRYFRALHPGVTLPADQGVTSCISCHPNATVGDFIASGNS